MKRLVLCILALLPLILPYRSEAAVPVLMYHHIAGNGDISVTISPELFSAQMAALQDNGFTAVTFDELYDFAVGNGELPDHPVAIVFDDGYRSVWDHAFPALRKFGMRATVCIIGWSVGKGTSDGVIPHFDWDMAREMTERGTFTIGAQTYAMHDGAVRRGNESADGFASRFISDYKRLSDDIYRETGESVTVFAYPHGIYDSLTESLLENLGARVTLTTDAGMNIIRRGHPEDLRLMKRYNIGGDTDIATLLEILKKRDK